MLTVLAIVVVISLPYLLNWFEPSPPARVAQGRARTAARRCTPRRPSPDRRDARANRGASAPAPAPAPKAAIAPPAAPAPAPKAVAEKAIPPASSEPARKAAPGRRRGGGQAPAKAATERPPAKAAEKAAAKTADKPAAPTRVVAKADAPSGPATVASAKPSVEASGNYWIQVGAFKEQKNADTLAKTLRDAGFPIHVTPITVASGGESKGAVQQHELFVTETSVEKVNAALKGRGTAQAVSGGSR